MSLLRRPELPVCRICGRPVQAATPKIVRGPYTYHVGCAPRFSEVPDTK